jgi:hypothetical protein
MLTLNIAQADIQRLKYERYNNPCPIIQKRRWSLYLKSTSKLTNGSICTYVGIHPDTLTDYTQMKMVCLKILL